MCPAKHKYEEGSAGMSTYARSIVGGNMTQTGRFQKKVFTTFLWSATTPVLASQICTNIKERCQGISASACCLATFKPFAGAKPWQQHNE